MMGGDLLLKDTGKSGTTFEMVIPLEKEPEVITQMLSEIYHNILLVEDNQVNQKLTRNILEKLGFNVDVANDGKEAVDKFEVSDYNLILMDIQMPVKNGIDASKEIRRIEKLRQVSSPVKIIALTANAQKQDKAECLEAGMNDYIRKPIDYKEFALVLGKL
jgi:CheY-like chemotaxis protein